MKGKMKRYKRWNPVDPTYGAFWGMGVGIGCGFGWGPGFGPQAIGYVGAGCGFGLVAGLGLGFPVNFLFQLPYNAAMASKCAALKVVKLSGVLSKEHFEGNDWSGNAPHVSEMQREACEEFSGFEQQHISVNLTDFFEMKNSLPLLTMSACETFRALNTQLFSSHRGLNGQSFMTGTSSATMQCKFSQEPPPASKIPSLVLITPYGINGYNYLRHLPNLMSSCDRGRAHKGTKSHGLSSVDDPKYVTLEAENNLMQSWLINSMIVENGKNSLRYKISHDAWTREKTSYSLVKSNAILFDIELFLHDFRQGSLDVTQYYDVLARHWQMLDICEIHQWSCESDAQYYNALKEEKRVYKFLIGLNPIFEKVRNHILRMDPLPTVEEVFHEVKREERRIKLTPSTNTAYDVLESSVLVAKRAHSRGYKLKCSESTWCAHCHTKELYRKIHGRPSNMKGRRVKSRLK